MNNEQYDLENKLGFILRNPPVACPVKGFPMQLKFTQGDIYHKGYYFLQISRSEFNADRYPEEDRIVLGDWLNKIMLPTLNTAAPGRVFLEVVD